MKYLMLYENYNDLEQQAKSLLVGKTIIANDKDLVNDLPFRITSDVLKFKPVDCVVVSEHGDLSLKIYVPNKNVQGTVSNKYSHQFTDEQATYMAMTAWIHWEITSKNLDRHLNVMVMPKPVNNVEEYAPGLDSESDIQELIDKALDEGDFEELKRLSKLL